jgi:hypothetical protein
MLRLDHTLSPCPREVSHFSAHSDPQLSKAKELTASAIDTSAVSTTEVDLSSETFFDSDPMADYPKLTISKTEKRKDPRAVVILFPLSFIDACTLQIMRYIECVSTCEPVPCCATSSLAARSSNQAHPILVQQALTLHLPFTSRIQLSYLMTCVP